MKRSHSRVQLRHNNKTCTVCTLVNIEHYSVCQNVQENPEGLTPEQFKQEYGKVHGCCDFDHGCCDMAAANLLKGEAV